MRKNEAQLNSDIRKLQLQVAKQSSARVSVTDTAVYHFTPPVGVPGTPQASNIMRNGDLSHSVRSWYETVATDDDENKECAHWYSHAAPVAAQQLYENTSKTGGSPNNTLKYSTHSVYSAASSNWDRATGQGRLHGTTTLDAPLPQNIAGAGKTEYLVMIAARRNSRISISNTARLFAGIWDNTSGQRDWLKANAAFTATGASTRTPAATLERRYKILATTDRGYTFLSDELVVTTAPSDASFIPNDVYVALSWTVIPEILSYEVYRYTPSSGVYALLATVTSGSNAYNDQNNVSQIVASYPTATDDRAKCYFATRTGEMANLAINGVAARWDTITMILRIPPQYDQSATTDKQWMRIGLSEAPDLNLIDAVTNATSTVTSAAAEFTAAHVGLVVTITDGGVNTLTTTIATYVSATSVTLAVAPSWTSTGNRMTVTGGGFNGVLIDLIHASYVAGAIYSPYFEDLNRALPAPATPNGSSQGGTGSGGGGGSGGGIHCIADDELVSVVRGQFASSIKAKDVRIGDALASGNLHPNYVENITRADGELYIVRTANGWQKRCTFSHRFITSPMDAQGTPLSALSVGDFAMTDTGGVIEQNRITSISATGIQKPVITFAISPGHFYQAGTLSLSWRRRLILFLLNRAGLYKMNTVSGGIFCHNLKQVGEFDTN